MRTNFEQFLFDDFEWLLQLWRKETNNSFLKEKSEYIYDSKAFRKQFTNRKRNTTKFNI